MTSAGENVRWGLGWGLFFFVVYSLIAVLILAIRGSQAFDANAASRHPDSE